MPDNEPLEVLIDELRHKLEAVPEVRVEDAKLLYAKQDLRTAREEILELKLEKAQLELKLERAQARIERMAQAPKWLPKVGVGFGLLTVVFLMAIVLLSIAGRDPSQNGKFALLAVTAFGAAFSAAAWIGNVVITGNIKTLEDKNPLAVSAAGGFAMFILVFLIGYWSYIR
jgi:hypothetical protein